MFLLVFALPSATMSACRSADRQPLAPLIELLRGTTKRGIQDVMIDVMPMITAPNMRKEDLIAMLADYVRNSGMLAVACNRALKGLNKKYLHMTLRQYDPSATEKRSKAAMIDHFIELNMPRESIHYDVPCMAIVPYVAGAGTRVPDYPAHAQLVELGKKGQRLIKLKAKLIKNWMKGGRLMRRKHMSAAIAAELKRCLRRRLWKEWTVASLRQHVSSVVGSSLHAGQALIFFNRKLQQLLPRKRPRKKTPSVHQYFAVPKKGFTVISDPIQWREMKAMRIVDRSA